MILIQSAGEHIHHKRLPFFQDYFNDVIRELESEMKMVHQVTAANETDMDYTPTTTDYPKVNPHDFVYLINPKDICNGNKLKYMIYVHSAPRNHKKRQTIRHTWGSRTVLVKYEMRVVFIMGVVDDKVVMDQVRLESNSYGDIVVENFLDSYRNLTYKAIAGLKWVSDNCGAVTYVIKSDDDILIDMHALMEQMNSTEVKSYGTRNLIMCNQWVRMKVIRDKKSKWYISTEEFPDEYFPPYCSGSVFIMSIDAVQKLFWASLRTTFFWVDDFYLTGLLVQKVGIEHKRLNDNYMLNAKVAMEKLQNDQKHELRFFHVHKLTDIQKMWNILKERSNSTCTGCFTWAPVQDKLLVT
jgi:beta-1,3-galactosyltransferase 1